MLFYLEKYIYTCTHTSTGVYHFDLLIVLLLIMNLKKEKNCSLSYCTVSFHLMFHSPVSWNFGKSVPRPSKAEAAVSLSDCSVGMLASSSVKDLIGKRLLCSLSKRRVWLGVVLWAGVKWKTEGT